MMTRGCTHELGAWMPEACVYASRGCTGHPLTCQICGSVEKHSCLFDAAAREKEEG